MKLSPMAQLFKLQCSVAKQATRCIASLLTNHCLWLMYLLEHQMQFIIALLSNAVEFSVAVELSIEILSKLSIGTTL